MCKSPLENLTTPRKWAVINALLCDRASEIIASHFQGRGRLDSGPESPESTSRRPRKTAAGCRALVFLFLFISIGFNALAQTPPSEYQIKAAFLFNFAKFVEWPPETFPQTNSPIVVGVLGKNVFGNDLEKTIRDKTINNHPFRFLEVTSAEEAAHCHILFISPSEKDNLPKIVDSLHNASVLTVSETDEFLKAGGMINFMIVDSKIRFQISDQAARKARLRISSKLLSLAVANR
jgi:hypothetical protein